MADNVVQITVTSKNSTKAGFAAAKADAEGAAASIGQIFEKMHQKISKDFGKNLGESLKFPAAAGGVGLGSGLLSMAGPIGAAGLAMGAFGAVAIPVLSKVSAASSAIQAAQLRYAQATTAAGRRAALNAEQAAISNNNLTKSQVGLIAPVNALQTAFGKLQDRATPAIGALLRLATALMPLFGTLVTAGGRMILTLVAPLTALFRSPFFAAFTRQIAAMATQLGTLLSPAFAGLIKWMPALLQMLYQLTPIIVIAAKVVAVMMTWLAANKLLVPALWLLVAAFVAMKLSLLANPIFLIGAAIAVLAFLVVKYHKQIWEFITRIWGDIFSFLKRSWGDILSFAKQWWPLIFGVAGLIVKYHNDIWAFIKRIWGDILGFFKRIWGDIGKAFKDGVRFVVDRFLDMAGWIIHAAATAFGWIPGIGPKLKDAAKAFDKFKNDVNRALGGVQGRTVNVDVAMALGTGGAHGQRTKGFASGTSGASPGWWWAGEEGPELVYSPHGGETVVPHGQSMRMTRGYASGVGVVPHLPSMASIQGVVNAGITAVAAAFARGLATIGTIGGLGGSGVARWAPVILRALGMLGRDSSNLGPVEHRMNQESGGNPMAINLTDINAQRGDPSRGLMQVIGATFARYRSFMLSPNIYDPMANTFAGLNYAVNSPAYRGRSLASVMLQPGGYRGGPGGGRMSPLRIELTVRSSGQSAFDRFMTSWLKEYVQVNGGGSAEAAFAP